jgi:hypothetical protein
LFLGGTVETCPPIIGKGVRTLFVIANLRDNKLYAQERSGFEQNTRARHLMFSFWCFFVARSLSGCGSGGQFPLDCSKLSSPALRALFLSLVALQSATHKTTVLGRCAESSFAIHAVSEMEVSDEEYGAARLVATRLDFFTIPLAEHVGSSSRKVGPGSHYHDVGQAQAGNAKPEPSLSGHRNVHAIETSTCLHKGGSMRP